MSNSGNAVLFTSLTLMTFRNACSLACFIFSFFVSCLFDVVSRSRSSEGRDENAYRITLPLDVVLSKSSAAVVERAHVLKVGCPDVSKPPPSKARCQDYDGEFTCEIMTLGGAGVLLMHLAIIH